MALTEMQTLILWSLLARTGGAGFQKDIRPEVKKPDRDALVKAGLITSEKRGRPGLWLETTDRGWAWAADHLDADLPKRSIHGAAILQAWLKRLKAFMAAKDFVLADVLAPPAPTEPRRDDYSALRGRIRRSYLEATGGRLNQRVFLNVLRDESRGMSTAPYSMTRFGKCTWKRGAICLGRTIPRRLRMRFATPASTSKAKGCSCCGSRDESGLSGSTRRRFQLDPCLTRCLVRSAVSCGGPA